MKALTICQPYAELIARGEKFVENRTWYTTYRGPLAIHAGLSTHRLGEWPPISRDLAREFPRGAIIAVCHVEDCLPVDQAPPSRHTHGPYCWLLADVVRLAEPIPCKGHLSLWNLPPDVLEQLTR